MHTRLLWEKTKVLILSKQVNFEDWKRPLSDGNIETTFSFYHTNLTEACNDTNASILLFPDVLLDLVFDHGPGYMSNSTIVFLSTNAYVHHGIYSVLNKTYQKDSILKNVSAEDDSLEENEELFFDKIFLRKNCRWQSIWLLFEDLKKHSTSNTQV